MPANAKITRTCKKNGWLHFVSNYYLSIFCLTAILHINLNYLFIYGGKGKIELLVGNHEKVAWDISELGSKGEILVLEVKVAELLEMIENHNMLVQKNVWEKVAYNRQIIQAS